jgi:hypothetical protein
MIVNDDLGLMRDYGYIQTTKDYEADFIQKVITQKEPFQLEFVVITMMIFLTPDSPLPDYLGFMQHAKSEGCMILACTGIHGTENSHA